MIKYLKQLDNKKLAEMWCCFNHWEYPEELIRFKPNNWELLPMEIKHKLNKPVIDYINSRVSEKELLREANKERHPGIDFDIWWEKREPLDDLSKKILKELYKLETSNLN